MGWTEGKLDKSLLLTVAFAAGFAFVAPCANAQDYGGDANPLVCGWLRERIVEGESQMNAARLNAFLFRAADEGCTTIAAELLDRGASLFARDRFANTALIFAAGSGHKELVRMFLDRGAAIDQANLSGSTALSRALARDRRDVADLLLARGASTAHINPNGVTLLATAAFDGDEDVVRLLLHQGADPAEPDKTGKGPIVYAAGKGYTAIVAMLLDAGLDVNLTYAHDLTALMWAAGHANVVPVGDGLATVELLVSRGADLDRADDRGRTALMIAAERGHAEIAAWLVAHGADPDLKDREGKKAIDLAAGPAVVEALTLPRTAPGSWRRFARRPRVLE